MEAIAIVVIVICGIGGAVWAALGIYRTHTQKVIVEGMVETVRDMKSMGSGIVGKVAMQIDETAKQVTSLQVQIAALMAQTGELLALNRARQSMLDRLTRATEGLEKGMEQVVALMPNITPASFLAVMKPLVRAFIAILVGDVALWTDQESSATRRRISEFAKGFGIPDPFSEAFVSHPAPLALPLR